MDATTALLVQGCACPPAAHAAVTAAMTSVVSPNVGTPIACDAGPYAEFDTVLEQMAGQLQTSEPRHGAEPAVAVESSKRNEHSARAACTDPEVDIRPAHDDDSDGDEDADGSDSAALRQTMVMAAGSAVTALVRESATVGTERPAGGRVRTAPQVEPKNARTSARVGGDQPARGSSPRSTGVPNAKPSMAPRVQEQEIEWPEGRTVVLPDTRGTADRDGNARVAPERLTTAATEDPIAIESEQLAEARSTIGQGRVSRQPGDRELTSVDARASQAEGAHVAVDPAHGSTAGQGGRATGGTPADEVPVRESVTASTERPVDGRVRTAPQVEPKNMHTPAKVGRDEPALNGSPRSMRMPAAEPGMAPRVQERETAWPEGRTMVLPDTQGTADSDGSPRVAPQRLTMTAIEEPMVIQSKQPAEARSTDGQGRVSQQPGDRELTSVDARASQAESAHVAVDQAHGSTIGTPAEKAPVRESVTTSAERPVNGRVPTAPQVESKNVHTSARVGRDEPARNSTPRSTGVPATEPGMAPQVQEREIAWPEGRSMALPDMRGTADRDANARVAPERLTMTAIEEPMATESEQPADAGSTDEQGRVSQQPGDRELTSVDARASQAESAHVAVDRTNGSTGGTLADEAPVRESVTASAERLVDGRVPTAPQVEPKNVHTSARVGRDEPARNSTPRSTGVPAKEPGMAPQVQEREIAWPEGRSMALPDMRGTADRDANARVAPERLTMTAIEEPMATESEQPADAGSTDEQGRVSEQPGDRTLGGPPADTVPVRESVTVSTERPVDGRVRTAPQVEPKNMHTPAEVGRDEPALNGSPGSVDVPVTKPGMAPRAQERTVAAMQERETARPEGRTMAQPDMRGTADRDGNARVAPERLTMTAIEEPMATELEQPTDAGSTDEQGRVSQQPGDRASGGPPADRVLVRESVTVSTERPVDGRVRTAPQVELKSVHTSTRVGRDEPARSSTPRSTGVPTTEPGMAREMVAVTAGKAAKAEMAESRQTALRSAAPRGEGAMTASMAVTVSRDWPEALVRSALVESLARHRNLPNPLWDDGLQKAGRRESEPNARPELAVVVGPTEGPDVSETPRAARPVLTEPAGSSVTRQIAAHVSARAAQGGGEFRARLVPEHLGSVQIRVRVVRGVCTADIRADDAEVARYIESHSSDLKVSLAEHGIDLSGLSVSSRSRAQEGWGAATLSHSESDWSAPSWNGANARQQYAAAAFAGGSSGHGRGERRGMPAQSSPVVGTSHHAARQSGSPSPDEPIATRWVRGYARIDYLA